MTSAYSILKFYFFEIYYELLFQKQILHVNVCFNWQTTDPREITFLFC